MTRRGYNVRPSSQRNLSVRLTQHPNEHRPERPILLAVDQDFAFIGLL